MAPAGRQRWGVGPAGQWLVLALSAFALLATGLFVAATLADRATTLAQGRTDAQNTAALLAEQADRALRVADISATRAVELAARHGVAALAADRWEELAAIDRTAPEVGSIWVLDPAGQVVATSVQRAPVPLDLSDRSYFHALAAGAEAHLDGLMIGRRTGTWFFSLNRALRQDGRLAAVVHVALHAELFERLAEGLDLGPGAQLKLLRPDGALLMRWPLPAGRPVPHATPRSLAGGMTEETGPDGIARLVAWRAAPTVPVIAVAAISHAHVLAPFHRRLQRNALLFALSLTLAGGLGAAALRAERRGTAAQHAAEERGRALGVALAERMTLTASLQAGEARLRMAQQAGGIGLWEIDLAEGRIALAGEVFGAWGLPSAPGGSFRSVKLGVALRGIHPADRAALAAIVAAAGGHGTPLAVEFRLAGPGPERWIGVRAEMHGQPRLGRLLGIALDVTPTRLAQQALEEARATLERRVAERTSALAEANARLREGEARFRGLFNATFQFIGLLRPDGTVLEANAAMLRLGGIGPEAAIGRAYWDAPWWPAEPATQALVRAAVADGAAGRFARREVAMRDVAGRDVAVDFSVTPVRDERGGVVLLVAEARDISALKAAQALLHEAQKMDTLGQLTGGVAHDFNNLLMAVLGNLEIARRRAGEEMRRRAGEEMRRRAGEEPGLSRDLLSHLDAAAQAAERGALLTQRLLAFARRQDLNPQPVDLRALLRGVKDLLARSAGPLVRLDVTAQPDLPPALVDPHALELALVNLAVNARDAMPEGGRLEIRLGLAQGDPPGRLGEGRWLAIAVTDTGAGMDEPTLARAVEPFFTTKGPGRGTGLGLSMVHGLAAQSGGALALQSAPGQGTTATLWLPVSASGPVAPVAPPPVALAAPGGGAVLVVDDEALVLESTAAMLEELGHEALRAESAEAALGLLAARRDVVAVLSDHAMPGMTGAALAARLRAERPGLPVILVTGFAGAWVETPGGLPRLAKPYGLAQLAAALDGVLAKAAAE